MRKLFVSVRAVLLLTVVLFACEEENEQLEIVTVQFASPSLEIVENGDEHTIGFLLSSPATSAGEFSVKIDPSNFLLTEPAAVKGIVSVSVPRGAVGASIKVKAIANSVDQPDQELSLSFVGFRSPLRAGELSTFKLTVRDDDEPAAPKSTAEFITNGSTISENDPAGVEYLIKLSPAAPEAGSVTVDVNTGAGVFARHFTTRPAITNGRIVFDVVEGQEWISLRVRPIENEEATGQIELVFQITETSGAIVPGANTDEILRIVDDELFGKPRGFVGSNGVDSYKTTLEYDVTGRLIKRHWEQYTPYKTSGTDEYFYNVENRIVRVKKHAYKDIVYTWSEGRIVKAEEIQEGVVKSYVNYGYDEAGNVALAAPYYRQTNGEFAAGIFSVYLYFTDGNVYKQMIYNPSANPDDEAALISTRTYENYLPIRNPFPMVDILPGIVSQKHLAGSYTVEENGRTDRYTITYELREDGQPAKRHVTGAGNNQTVEYSYY